MGLKKKNWRVNVDKITQKRKIAGERNGIWTGTIAEHLQSKIKISQLNSFAVFLKTAQTIAFKLGTRYPHENLKLFFLTLSR